MSVPLLRPLGSAARGMAAAYARRTAPPAGRHRHVVPLADPREAVPADVFRTAMGAYPSAVSVLTAYDSDGLPRGLTCSAVSSLAADPPLVLACINRSAGALEAVRRTGAFGLNLLRGDRQTVSATFASRSERKFDGLTWRPAPVSGVPWLQADAAVFLDCQLVAELEVATHVIAVGLVRHGVVPPDRDALVYCRREYGSWVPAAADPPAVDLLALARAQAAG
jgi:flavin reductase (NADH)